MVKIINSSSLIKKYNIKKKLNLKLDGLIGSSFSIIIRIDKCFYYTSKYNKCFLRAISNLLSTYDLKCIKLSKSVNSSIREYNKKLIEQYFFIDRSITRLQFESFSSNNKKIELTVNHPLVCINQGKNWICMAETSRPHYTLRRTLTIEEIKKCNISYFHNADKLIIKEFNGKFYVLAFWKIDSEIFKNLFKFEDVIKDLSLEEKENLLFFIQNNFSEFYSSEIYISSFWKQEQELKIVADYNIENNIISKEDFNKRTTIDFNNINKGKEEL